MVAKAQPRSADRRSSPRPAARPAPATHYATLGIRPGATQAEIRQAYLALIKQHHPDISGADAPSDVARAVNHAYRTLSDAARRGRYDATLGMAHTVTLRSLPVAPSAPNRRTRWGSRLAALSLLTVAGCYLLYARQAPTGEATLLAALPAEPAERDTVRAHRAAVVQQAGLNFEWVALQSDATAAERYSQQCWESLLGSGSDSLFDYCLAFDSVGERTYAAERGYFAVGALNKRARVIGRNLSGESVKQRLARVDVLLARERPSGKGLPPPVSWFPIPVARDAAAAPLPVPFPEHR